MASSRPTHGMRVDRDKWLTIAELLADDLGLPRPTPNTATSIIKTALLARLDDRWTAVHTPEDTK